MGDTILVDIPFLPFLTSPATAPAPFDLFHPPAGQVQEVSFNFFNWQRAIDSTSLTPLNYGYEISNSPDFSELLVNDTTGADTFAWVEGYPIDRILYWRAWAEDSFGFRGYSADTRLLFPSQSVDGLDDDLPKEWAIVNLSPNPFNSFISVTVSVPDSGSLEALIYDSAGRLVTSLHSGSTTPGYLGLQWNGAGMASGMYFLTLKSSSGWHETRKLVMIK